MARNLPLQAVPTEAPTTGWVTNINIANMPPKAALIMDNWFPRANTVDLIAGYMPWATGVGTGPVEMLAHWNGPAGTAGRKMLAAGGGGVYDATNNAPAVLLKAGYVSNRWQTAQMGTPGGQFLLGANGSDTPFIYNGVTFADAAVSGTGLDPKNLIGINSFKERLFWLENNKLGFWYMPVSTIGGAMQYFDLSQFAKRGGYLMAMGNWTRDTVTTTDAFAVFMTSEGEVLIYQGDDPGDATAWGLVGNYFVGAPIGRRCMEQYANDLMTITVSGFQLMSQIVVRQQLNLTAEGQSLGFNFSNILPTVLAAAQNFRNNFGWEVTVYPRQRMALFNIPIIESNEIQQYVVNTDTGAWCRFRGQNAATWLTFAEDLYYGGLEGVVYLSDSGQDFNGQGIQWELKTAFNYFGNPGLNKQFQMIQPVFISNGPLTFNYGIDVDFGNVTPAFGNTISSVSTPWGSPWGSPWSQPTTITQDWLSAGVTGRCASFHMAGNTKNYSLSLAALNWTFMAGGVL